MQRKLSTITSTPITVEGVSSVAAAGVTPHSIVTVLITHMSVRQAFMMICSEYHTVRGGMFGHFITESYT